MRRAEVSIEATIVDRAEVPVYLKIAEKAKHLQELGMSAKRIAQAPGVNDKTIAKALRCHAGGSS